MANTKEKILFACEELAIRKGRGFYYLSVEEVAKMAGVSKRTVYRYFSSKDELVEAALNKMIGEIMAKNFEIVKSNHDLKSMMAGIVKNVAGVINEEFLADVMQYNPLLWHKIDRIRQKNVDKLFDMILAGNEIKMRWRVDPRIFKASLFAAMSAVLNPKFIMASGIPLEEAINSFLEMFLFGALEPSNEPYALSGDKPGRILRP